MLTRLLPVMFILSLLVACASHTANKTITTNQDSFWQRTILSAATSQDLWQEIRNNFSLDHHEENPLVQSQLHWLKSHPKYLERICARAEPYLYHIYQEVKRRHMPAEMVLVPVIESAYNPFVYSKAGAAGLWQIMPVTATHLGITHSWWHDGRRDLLASTKAALNYLDYLHKFFKGNWYLAMAAYDAGEGTVDNSRKRNARAGYNTDFWSLRLPAETRAYLPRLLAIAMIMGDPKAYGLHLPVLKNQAYFQAVNIGSQMDLAQAAKLAGISLEKIYLLNPGYNHWATNPDGPHQLLIPVNKVTHFKAELAKLPQRLRMRWQRYKVKQGDSIGLLAHRFDTKIALIKKVNKLSSNTIRLGQVLFIPIAKHDLPKHSRLLDLYRIPDALTHKRVIIQPTKTVYQVQPGDSLWTIAKKHAVPIKHIRHWNHLKQKELLHPGKKLVIWKKKKTTVPINPWQRLTQQRPKTIKYQIKSGDTLSDIALKYHSTVADIKHRNHLKSMMLKIGQKLAVRTNIRLKNQRKARKKPAQPRFHRVKSGDTLSQIADSHHTNSRHLMQLNHLKSSLLHIGQQIRVS